VCILADQDIVRSTGSSLDFLVEHLNETVSFAEWKFNGNIFAEYDLPHYTFPQSQFSGRLEENHHEIGVTIKNLQPQDSGTFSVVTFTTKQRPTKIFKVYVNDPITDVRIETTQTWKVSTNSCDVNVKCAALKAERVSYLWSGYKTGSGAQLQFSLSPADGAVILKCTATNNLNNITATETLRCRAEQLDTGPIQHVQIEKNQTWKLSTNSCDVSVKCAATETESVFYLWSGYKTASGAQLQFSLSPAEGAVTLNCTAANNISNITATETLSCRAEQPSSALLSALKPISSVVAVSPYLLVTIILGVKCCKAR
ncbi:SLAM family member 8-like, partial [Clarias magur]